MATHPEINIGLGQMHSLGCLGFFFHSHIMTKDKVSNWICFNLPVP